MEGETLMLRLRCAVRAGWLTVLIGFIILLLSWLVWRAVGGGQISPETSKLIWGFNMADYQSEIIILFGIFKLILWEMALVMLFLTLWLRELRRCQPSATPDV